MCNSESLPDVQQTGMVFNLQRYSLHDGQGIRTVVFLKGCPLRCRWCCNPESQQRAPEMMLNPDKCLGQGACDGCRSACPRNGLQFHAQGKITLERSVCQGCSGCNVYCPSKALQLSGRTMSVAQVLKAVEADALFFDRSGGGLTLSGGEPLMQPHFAQALLREARRRRIHTVLETCGYGSWSAFQSLAPWCNMICFDIKSLDDEQHRAATGKDTRRIISNLLRLRAEFPTLPVHVRTPLIPGFNHNTQEISRIIERILPLGGTYEVLPYHRLGQDKYRQLGRDYPMGDTPPDARAAQQIINQAREHCATRYGLPA